MEIDAIGEIMNISLGSSATAVSNMLDHRVDITTPTVSVINAEDFFLGPLEPAIGVEIKYVSGLEGSNILLLKMSDIKVIVDILMGMETPDEEFVLNDLTLSAVCEVMNQMMGAASTALSDFLGKMINISTPQTFDVDDLEAFKNERLPVRNGPIVIVHFALSIESKLKSEFMNVMSVDLAREIVSGFGLEAESGAESEQPSPAPASNAQPKNKPSTASLSQEEIERLMAEKFAVPQQDEASKPHTAATSSRPQVPQGNAGPAAAPPQAAVASEPPMTPSGQMPGGMPGYPPYPPNYYNMPYYGWPAPPNAAPNQPAPNQKLIQTQSPTLPALENGEALTADQAQNLDLIMNVPLEVTVEIGRTRRRVQEILSFTKGSLVVLDKLAGEQVDLFVNGKCIAHGDVVVVDDNFGIRISEIIKTQQVEDRLIK